MYIYIYIVCKQSFDATGLVRTPVRTVGVNLVRTVRVNLVRTVGLTLVRTIVRTILSIFADCKYLVQLASCYNLLIIIIVDCK